MSESASVQFVAPHTLAVHGVLTFFTVPDLVQTGQRAIQEHKNVLVDLSAVTHCDSAGLALLVEWLRTAKTSHCELAFAHIPEQLRAIMQLCGLDGIGVIHG